MENLTCSASDFSQMLDDILNDGASVPLCVTGTSMHPFLVEGRDTVWLGRCRDEDIKRGRIILFRRNDGTLVLHRIRKVSSDKKLTVNGDAQVWCETVNTSQIIAAVYYIERNGTKIKCDGMSFRFKSETWQIFKPLRLVLLKIWGKFKK